MGAGSSAEQRSPQDGAPVAGESQPGSPEGQTPNGAAAAATTTAAPEEPEEDPGKLLQKNGQISSLNGIAEEQVALSLKPEELNGQKTDVDITDVVQRETATTIQKEESVENMEIKLSESSDKTNADIEQKDTQGIDQLSPSAEDKVEEQGQPSESLSSDVGFKKVFKLVGFKFTVRKEKTEKVEPVQLVNVKADGEAEVASGGGGDSKEVKTETVDEATQSEVLNPVEKTEQETQTDQKKEESLPETITESPLEAESKQEEVKNDGTKSPESPTSPVTTETASPLRKFFTQGWAGFRKKTSFRKPKEEEQQAIEKDIEEQVKEVAEEETAIGEELEKEKPVPEKDQTEISMEVSDVKAEKETEETKMVDVSTETHGEDAVMPREQPPTNESAEPEIKEPEISLKEKSDLASEEVSTQTEECLMALEQSTLAPSEKEPEATALLAGEAPEGQTDQSDLTSPMAIEMVEEPFEIIEADKSEPEASVLTEMLDEKSTEMSTDSSTIEKKEEPETTPKEELVLEQLVETVNETESGQSTEEQLTVKDTSPEDVNEHLKQTEPSTVTAATSKPPEGITNEVELLSSQERAKIQGSPLKKLFTSSSLKKLSGKKRKGKKAAAKSGEAGEQMQQLSDSAESPEDPRGESSASSPEEATDSVEKVDASQNTESEEGSALDVEKKRESVTPWASFKKMVTPKKRVRRLSESDKEDELDKAKTTTLSSTESGPNEEQEEIKEIAEEQKLEKSTEEPKRKVDTSVSWEALICVGSSKKRSRKSSSSDEEVGQRLAQEGQKIDEGVPNKEVAAEATLTSSHESDQGQGNSSPEQVGSPSEGEGVSTWESFKRLVTPRRKSKTRMEEKSEESATVPSLEHSTSDTDSGKEESWVSFKKLMPGRRKKKSDGVPEHAPVQESGEEMAETNEEDYDVPAVVPLSEYEAAEQEKFEAQMAKQVDKAEKNLEEEKEKQKPGDAITEQSNEGLMHAVTVTVVEGERAVTSIEERSPSWISAAVTESIEQANEDEERKTEPISETGVVEETVVDTKLMPEIKKDISGDTIVSELTSEAITAREEPSGVEEGTEISCAEETTEMVSAVSRLSESPDTTEIATPVQEVEENQEELNKQTQEILQEVAERVQVTDEASVVCESISEVVVQPVSVVKPAVIIQGAELSEMPLKEEEAVKTDIQTDGGMKSNEGQVEVKEGDLKEILEQQKDVCMEVPGSTEVTYTLDRTDESDHPKSEQEIVEESEKNLEKQKIDEKSDDEDEFVIVTVTPEKEQKVTDGDTTKKKEMLLKEMDSGEYGPTSVVLGVKMTVEATTPDMIIDVPKVDELMKVTCEEKPQFSPKQEKIVDIVPDWQSEPTEQGTIEVTKPLLQNELQEADILIESPDTGEFVPEAPTQSKITEVIVKDGETKVQDVDVAREAVLGAKTGSAEEVAVEEQVHGETVETEVPIRKLEVDVPKQKAVAEDYVQRMVTDGHLEEMEKKTDMQSMEDVMLVKPEVKDMETKIEYILEKTDVPEPMKVAETHITVQGVHTVLAVDIEEVTKTTDVVSEALTEKDEVEPLVKALTEETGVMMDMGAVTKKAGTKVEVLTATEGVASKIDVEASTKEADAKVEGMIPEEMVTSSGQACGKLEKEVPKAVMDMESRVETSGAEIAEKEKAGAKVEVVSATEEVASKTDVEASTREADAKLEGMLPEEKMTSSGQAGGKLEKEVPKAVMDMESSVKTSGPEVAEKESAGSKVEVVIVTEEVASKIDVEASIEEADTKIEGMMSEEMVMSLGQAGEKLEKEVPKAVVDMESSVETSGAEDAEKESAGSKMEVVTVTEEVASKTDVEASTKEADAKVEGMMSEEMVTSSGQAGGKLEKEVPKAVVDMESSVKTSGPEVAEKESAGSKVEVVTVTEEVASKTDVEASTKEADTKIEGMMSEEMVTSSVQAGEKLEKEVPKAFVDMECRVETSGTEVAEKETAGAKVEVVSATQEVASKIDVNASTEEADTKVEGLIPEEKVTSSVQAGGKLEKEVPEAVVDVESSVKTSGPEVVEKETAGAKVKVVTVTEEVASKIDVEASTKEADTKIEGMVSEEMVTSSGQAGEKLEKEVPKAVVDMESNVETSGAEVAEKEKAGAKVEVVSATEEVASKIDVEASTKEANTKIEGMVSEEMVTSSGQAGGKLEKEVPKAVVDMESSVKTSGPEVAEKESAGSKVEVVTVTEEVASKTDVEASTKEADTKIEGMMSEEMVTSSVQAGEKLEKQVPKAVVDMESNVETSGAEVAEKEKAGAKVEVVSATEEVASKIDVEASTKEADTKVEGLIPEEKVTSSGQAGGKLEKEVPEAVVGMESSVKTSGPEVAEKETAGAKVEVVTVTKEVASKIDVEASTKEADTKVEGLIPEEKVTSSGQAGGKLEKEVPEALVGMESSVKTSGPEVAEKETAGAKVEVVTVTKEVASKIDVEASTKEADTKIEGMVFEEMVTSSGQAGEKLEKEVPKAVVDVESNVETSGAEVAEKEKAGAKVEVVSATEEVASKIDVEASTKEADTKVEGLIPEEKVMSSGQAGGKLEKEVPEAVVHMESSLETSGPEVAEKKSEMEVPPENTDMDHSTEEAKVVSSSEKSDTEILTKKAEPEVPIEKTEVKACEEIIREKVDAEVAMMDPAKKLDEKDPAEQSEVLAKAGVTAEQPEKETSEEIQKEIVFLSDVEGAASSLVMCAEPVSAEASLDISTEQELVSKAMTKVPLQTETPNVAISLESKTPDALVTVTLSESKVKDGAPASGDVAMVQTGTEAPKERGLDERLVSKEDTVDLTQAVVGDARLILRSQIPEGIKADAPESKDKVSANDVILVETKLDKESIIQKEISIPHIKTEEEALTFRDTTDSEGHMQSEKEEALCLESRYTKAAENIVQSEATGDTAKIEIGKGHVATELDPTQLVMLETVVEGSMLSDTGYLNSEVSNAVLENMSDGTPLGSSEVSQNGITVPTETCPDKLPLEAVPQVLEHTATSDSYQTKQGLSEKAQIKEEEKSSESIELASGDVCHANSVQQEVFTEQQAAVTISIPEAPSCTAYKSSVTVTAAEVEEQIIAENVASAAASNETLQPLPEEQQETEFKLVQQVSFAHSVCGTIDPDTEIVSKKTDSTLEKPVSPTVSCTKDDLLQKCVFHPIPEMKHQKPETSQEAGEKTTPRERSQSLTQIEFQKDVVQSVTIESQSTKIILKIIQNAVDKLEETEVTKQQSGSHLVEADKSETQTDLRTDLQPFVKGKEERSQEIQASSITQPAEKQYAFKTVEEMPLHSEKSDDEKSADSSKPKAVKHTSHVDEERCTVATLEEHPGFPSEVTTLIIKEKGLQQENGEPKDTAVSTETQRDILEGVVSVDVPKESLGLDQPKLKDTEVGQTIQNREQLSEQQTHVKRKDESPLTETVERDVNNQGCTSCKSPQLKSEVAES